MKSKKKAAAAAAEDNSQVYLERKRKKIWVDKKSGHNGFTLYARSFYIAWGNQDRYWNWNCFKETDDENIEVAKLVTVCWLEVKGMFDLSDISPEIVYEIVFVVKLTKGASGWELPVTLQLTLPNEGVRKRQVIMLEKPRGEWTELIVGNFSRKDGETGEVNFVLSECGGHWKNGLIIKCAILRPKC